MISENINARKKDLLESIEYVLKNYSCSILENGNAISIQFSNDKVIGIAVEANGYCIYNVSDEWAEKTTYLCEKEEDGTWYYNLGSIDECIGEIKRIAESNAKTTFKSIINDGTLLSVFRSIEDEYRLEELIPMCDKLLVMMDGSLTHNGAPREVISALEANKALLASMPTAARLFHFLSEGSECPLTLREGRRFLEANYKNEIGAITEPKPIHSEKKALEFKDVYFRYERELPDVLKGLSFAVYENEIFCILGGNGSGKTTALSCASGIRRVYSGQIRVFGKKLKEYSGQTLYRNCLTLLPQDVQSVFLCNTVREELADAGADAAALPFDMSQLLDKHPYDLSGGESQLLALAKVLATKPRLLLMDEPTKGLDAEKKQILIDILRELKAQGVTVLIVTHDVEFAATCADRCALFFRGDIVSVGTPHEFFSENSFYTTAASRMTKGYFANTVTVKDIADLCLKNGRKERENG